MGRKGKDRSSDKSDKNDKTDKTDNSLHDELVGESLDIYNTADIIE